MVTKKETTKEYTCECETGRAVLRHGSNCSYMIETFGIESKYNNTKTSYQIRKINTKEKTSSIMRNISGIPLCYANFDEVSNMCEILNLRSKYRYEIHTINS